MNRSFDIKRFFAGVFTLLFVAYYTNATMFSHTHVVNGVTIVHSHFYGEDHGSTPESEHTSGELTIIAHLNNIISTDSDVVASAFEVELYAQSQYDYSAQLSETIVDIKVHERSLRAPPVL